MHEPRVRREIQTGRCRNPNIRSIVVMKPISARQPDAQLPTGSSKHSSRSERVEHARREVRLLVFDVFGSVVDWRTSIARDLGHWGQTQGVDADWEALALA